VGLGLFYIFVRKTDMEKEPKIDGFLLALMICLTITALLVVLHVANQNKIEMEQNYEREHFAPIQQGL